MLKTKLYQDAAAFYQDIEKVFLVKEAEHNLILGVARQLIETPQYFDQTPLMGCVYDEDQLLLGALMTPPRDLLLAANTDDMSAALDVFASTVWQKGIPVNGVNAEKGLSLKFAHLWSHRGAFKAALKMNQRIYRLDRVKKTAYCTGKIRLASEEDRIILVDWAKGFLQESLGEEPTHAESLVDAQLNNGTLFVWEDHGIVSMAAKSRETINGAVVSFVYTPPEKRQRGYATALVARLSEYLLTQGYQFCALFTDLANPTSNAIYQKIGYYPVMDFDRYEFTKDLS